MLASPVYLDECVDYELVEALRERGFTVAAALDVQMLRATDEQQLVFATARGAVLVSHNRRDFQRLHATFIEQGRKHGGIVLLPGTSPLPRLIIRAATMLDWIGLLPDHRSQLFQWGYLQEQIERGYRIPGYTEDDVRLALGRSL